MLKVILGFGSGNLENGCDRVTVKIHDENKELIAQGNGSLIPCPQLWELYKSWKSSFRSRFGGRIGFSDNSASSSSMVDMELSQCIDQFPREFNRWLNYEGFLPIERLLRNYLNLDATISFTVEAEDNQLRRLPWYLWEFFDDYHYAEPTLAFTKYDSGRIGRSKRDNIRILVVIGDSQGIDTEVDQKIFEESLENTQIKILSQPSRQELDESLWDEQGWDILAFLGHSGSSEDGKTGSININKNESLSLGDLKNALKSAIQKGLKLAIFNSCDGLGLVRDLRDLYLPHTIVMREPVPDKIAQEFIKNFLPAFKTGLSLSIAVREAREKLQKWEKDYPCATWLPVLCQNPAVESINWVNLGGKPACPYRGLFAFKEEDADIFFGREVVSEELYQKVERKEPLIAVVGASGSGKSSVVFAGLVPRLRNTEVEIVNFRPGRNPFESLAVALAPLFYFVNPEERGGKRRGAQRDINGNLNNYVVGDLENLITKLKDKRGLCEVVETIIASSSRHLVIIADQFEELYTLLPQSDSPQSDSPQSDSPQSDSPQSDSPQSEEKDRDRSELFSELFLDSLLNAVNDSPAFTLVLTLRADFFHYAIQNRKFADALRNTNYPLGPMNREELQRAIRLPAEKQGVKLEADLLRTLLDDVGEKAENLPLLEFALTQLWTKQEYGLLKTAAYREIGGLQKSLARHAENIYTQLEPEQRQRMQRVFIQLVRPGEGATDTRNVVSKNDLQDEDWELITRLNQEDARLVVINYDQNKRETVEVVHEALINAWGRLNRWMGYHRHFRTWQERLKLGMKNWQEKQRDDGYLLSVGVLGEAEGWLKSEEHREYLSDAQREFIQLSLNARDKEEAEKERQRQEKTRWQKRAIRWLGGGLLAASAATGFAGWNWVNAEITSTRERLNSSILTSENYVNLESYSDALFEGLKTQQSLDDSLWKSQVPSDIKQKIQVAINQPIHSFIETKHTIRAHKNSVWSVVFSPDGKTIASASSDGTVKLWNADNRNLIDTLEGHKNEVLSVVFSPDGKTIASASSDGTVKLWNAENRNLIDTLEGHKNSVLSVVFSPDNKTIASASTDKTVRLWNWNFDNLIPRGCNKLEDYLINSPDKLEDLKICQNQEILTAAASTLVEEGESSAENGNFEEALKKFRQAKEWNPELDINPEAKAAIAFVGEGRELAFKGNFEGAVEKFKQAQQFDANIDLIPRTKELDNKPKVVAGQFVTQTFLNQGRELASEGNFEDAVEKFKQAQRFDANIDLIPRTKELDNKPKVVAGKLVANYFVIQGRELLQKGDVKEAIATYNKALKIDSNPQNAAQYWNSLCWFGSLYNYAKDVMFACNKAVALKPKSGMILDSRGLARALTGDYKGAIEDFEVFVKQSDDDKSKSQRQSWIKDLRDGKKPFTPQVLEELRKE